MPTYEDELIFHTARRAPLPRNLRQQRSLYQNSLSPIPSNDLYGRPRPNYRDFTGDDWPPPMEEFLPYLQEALLTMATALSPEERGQILVGLVNGLIGPGEVWRVTEDNASLEGLGVTLDVQSTQQDILIGSDTLESVTAASIGGLFSQRTIPYQATLTVNFTGDTPTWGLINLVDCTGAVAIQADTFPAYMVGKTFTTICKRVSGTGNITVQNNASGANVEFRDGLSSIPALGVNAGSDVVIDARVMAANMWRIENATGKTL